MPFTSRGPRNTEEINTCIAMLEDSPLWTREYRGVVRQDVVRAWEALLTTGQGFIEIVENAGYEKRLLRTTKPRKNPVYKHNFFSCDFVAYITPEFMREMITQDEIPDISWHFVQSYVAHLHNPSSPSPLASVAEIARNQKQGKGLYGFAFFVMHPEIDLSHLRVLLDLNKYARRLRRSSEEIHGGVAHSAWINNIAREDVKQAYVRSGHRLLREYPDNPDKINSLKKYVLCLTKTKQVSDELGIPDHIQADLEHDIGNWFAYMYYKEKPIADLTQEQQMTCYLITLGYTQTQIAETIFLDSREDSANRLQRVRFYQNQSSIKLKKAGYDIKSGHREDLRNVILHNMHEVRSFIIPLYPWPEGLVLPD